MKFATTLFAAATATLLTANLFAAPVTQYLKLIVTDNSNLTVQQPTSIEMSFSSLGTNGLDAYDMGNQNSLGSLNEMVYPFALTDNNDIVTSEDASPDLISYKRIRFGFATKFAATIKIIAYAFGNSSDSTNQPTYAWIEQISTGYIYPILSDTVKIDVPANLNFDSDFYLHTGPKITTGKINETCYHSYNGAITVSNPNMNNWNLKLYKNTTLILNTTVSQQDTVVSNLTSANYKVVTLVNSIPVDSSLLFVDGAAQIIPDFSIDNYNPTTNDTVNFQNASYNAASYSWDFGDGSSPVTSQDASHQYLSAGSYGIVLTATNEIGCQETVYDSVFVTGSTTFSSMSQGQDFHAILNTNQTASADSNMTKPFDPALAYTPYTEKIIVTQNDEQILTVRIMDMGGRFINAVTSADASIELSVPQAGMYIVQMISSKGEMKSKTILITN